MVLSQEFSDQTLHSLLLTSQESELLKAQNWLKEGYEHLLQADNLNQVALALQEWLANVIHYAHRDRPDNTICLKVQLQKEQLEITVCDEGEPFDFEKKLAEMLLQKQEQQRIIDTLNQGSSDTELDFSLFEALAERGRGLCLIKDLMDEVIYCPKTSSNPQNCLIMRKQVQFLS